MSGGTTRAEAVRRRGSQPLGSCFSVLERFGERMKDIE
jgi:hypothetical protein